MSVNVKVLFIVLVLISFIPGVRASALDATGLHLRIMDLKEGAAPVVLQDNILFTFKSEADIRSVAIRFEHEDYNVLHVYEYNQHYVYFLLYPIPEKVREIKYRIVVNGVWMADPFNPQAVDDDWGIRFSVFTLDEVRETPIVNPLLEGNRAAFRYLSEPGRAVYIAGDFNDWDPYMHRLRESDPGFYEIILSFTPGKHYYYFLVDGVMLTDPFNKRFVKDHMKEKYSTFTVGPRAF